MVRHQWFLVLTVHLKIDWSFPSGWPWRQQPVGISRERFLATGIWFCCHLAPFMLKLYRVPFSLRIGTYADLVSYRLEHMVDAVAWHEPSFTGWCHFWIPGALVIYYSRCNQAFRVVSQICGYVLPASDIMPKVSKTGGKPRLPLQ